MLSRCSEAHPDPHGSPGVPPPHPTAPVPIPQRHGQQEQ